jgi:stage V sporulation protein D (sporulation-specific penicillin-binding protein)
MRSRIKLIAAFFLAFFVLLVIRLAYWQLVKGGDLSSQARNQYESQNVISAPRGNILVNDKTWLVARGEAFLVFAEVPKIKLSPKEIANKLAPFFLENADDKITLLQEIDRIETLLKKKGLVWVPLKQKIAPDVKANIEALNIEGIGFERVEDRIYPEASAAAHLLGFVGKDVEGKDIGYFGLEGYYNSALTGKPGMNKEEKDAKGRTLTIGDTQEISAIGGVDLLTNVDKTIQLLIERKLKEGVEKYGASGGTIIVMNPQNGAILAMTSYPSFDPRTYWEYGDEYFKNPAISFTFEPGSVFKIVVMASALDAGVVKPDTKCDICTGAYKVDKYLIETWNRKYHPDSTMQDVIVNSDNVGMVYVANKMGADLLYDYLNKFGLGRLTGIDLQGEVTPKLREKGTWNVVDLATASFGQGIAVTPMQMIKAAAIIANGGLNVTPKVVNKLMGKDWEEEIKTVDGERVISKQAAKEMTAIMVEAARNGESKWTSLQGFKVAGKTGTAQIPISGHYDAEKTIASFIGFAPADNPKFIMFVSLKEPKTSTWASETAAPLWYSIARELFTYLGIQPEN